MKKRKNKAQQAVAAVVMGMNLVNTMSPLALAAQAPVQPEALRPAPQAGIHRTAAVFAGS